MKLEINREQYEELKENKPKGLKLDMECKYWMEFEPVVPKRKSPTKRRSPMDNIEPGQRWSQVASTAPRELAHGVVEKILFQGNPKPGEAYMASGELSNKVAEFIHGPGYTVNDMNNASYAIGELIKEKILRIRRD